IKGKDVVIIGRSNIVGKPLALMLTNESATVTLCHSKTKKLKEKTINSDIVIIAVGIENFLTEDMVKKGSIVIDAGINRNSQGQLCGDVDYENVSKKTSFITPVPGGVGPMTIAMLMKNTLKSRNNN
ncbi:MAG: bifunctional methylenetetrahydrofolate dehydrogenase/methenyltetrahydrofolate cyclohydrolase, partial [Psychrilyobacter sp.]|nr:bifunctional methylenetetrahydrofolate dehydrogenase/methenyltetrahydrofolate cyclohydrolase [Psychrilyobacter sp.]